MFDNFSKQELMDFIQSDEVKWQGERHGDTVEKYQGRQCLKAAAALILMGRDLSSGNTALTKQEAIDLFFTHVEKIGQRHEGHGNSNFDLQAAKSYWKFMY